MPDVTYADALNQAIKEEMHRDESVFIMGESIRGGIYGVTLGSAFFGESMFSRRTDASKLAMAWLVDRLRLGGFTLFDAQFLTPHLASLGFVEIPRAHYKAALAEALALPGDFIAPGPPAPAQEVLQRSAQTS